MLRLEATLALAIIVFTSAPAFACLGGPRLPQTDDLTPYSEIWVVQATGIHLTEYEAYRLMERGARPWPEAVGDDVGYIFPTSSTPEFDVFVLVEETIKGKSAHTQRISLGGCGVRAPRLRDYGIVFVEAADANALAVWQSQGEAFTEIAKALGIRIPSDEP